MFERISAASLQIGAIAGWRRLAAAAIAGALAALAMAPFYLTPLLPLAYCALLVIVDAARIRPRGRRASFAAGWAFGFGFHVVGLYWLAFSFFVQAKEFAWMAPFAVLGMPAFLGLFSGAAMLAYAALAPRGARRIFVFAAVFSLAEYGRGHILTGLPWNLPGQALAGAAAGVQSAALWGVYGLSLAVIVIALAPAALSAQGAKGWRRGSLLMLAAVAALYAAGFVRLMSNPASDVAGVAVRVVQPNIPQREKIDNSYWWRNLDRHITLSAATPPEAERLFILWPENAAPILDEVDEAIALIGEKLPQNAVLVAGAVRRETAADGAERYFNSIDVLQRGPDGMKVAAFYDKHHLVPFGEYLPMQGLLRAIGLAQLAPYDDGFAKGSGPATLSVAPPAFAPLICYEAVFPGRIYPKAERPAWIAGVTNDSWFGDSSGPRQHLDQARLRAIETGLPFARAANSGVSAIIDASGRYRARIALYEQGVADAPLPVALPATLYVRFGDAPFLILAIALVALAFFQRSQGDS
jgi:apolipoprotein N-acyltransferase